MQPQKISVLLAAYNGSRFIRAQLDSILQQSYGNFELLICDDCSTDETPMILAEYAQKDSRITLWQNEQNIGFKKNFERLLGLASCEYIALSDQDDIWTNDHLKKLMAAIGNNDLVCGNAYLADSDGNPTGVTLLECSNIDFLPKNKDDWFMFLLHGSIFQGASCLFRKSLLSYIQPIPETVRFHDYWIAVQAAQYNGVTYINEPILYYRQHGKNVTTNKKWSIKEKIKLAFVHAYAKEKNSEHISFLSALIHYSEKKQTLVSKALYYYTKGSSFARWLDIPYFIKNYRLMYLSKNRKLFVVRFIKKFILWK